MSSKRQWVIWPAGKFWLLAVTFLALICTPAVAQSGGSAKITPSLQRALAAGGVKQAIVVLDQQADLSGAAQFTNKVDKTRYVYEKLRATADRSQPPVIAALSRMGIAARSLYIVDALVVSRPRGHTLTTQAIDQIAARSDVAEIDDNAQVKLPPTEPASKPVSTHVSAQVSTLPGVEWNVAFVHAPTVWEAGYTGQGVVVGIIDTGVDWAHRALIHQYRGYDGTIFLNQNYNWWDAWGAAHGSFSAAPIDPNGHGTFVTGIAVGSDGHDHKIGVAPGAKWIACRAFGPDGTGSASDVLGCLQFMLAPWNLNGQYPDPAKAPDVINNSYGNYGSYPLSVARAFENLQAAGIFNVAAVGNKGDCGTIGEPAEYPWVFAVGALSYESYGLAYFSNRGPGTYNYAKLRKPDVVAPGQDIISAFPPDTYRAKSGTSMASPMVAGTVALIWSARPGLFGDVTDTETLLRVTALPQVSLDCGSTAGDFNYLYGYGAVDAAAAALSSSQWPISKLRSYAQSNAETYAP